MYTQIFCIMLLLQLLCPTPTMSWLFKESNAQDSQECSGDSCSLPIILVAAASATTAQSAISILSASGEVRVRAFLRKFDSPIAKALEKLPNVELFIGDFDDEDSVVSSLIGVSRAMLVSSAGQHEMFDRETSFIAAAQKANIECIVRISTASFLISTGSTSVYARAHACIEKFIESTGAPVVDLNPNWFMDNILSSASEAKATGQISLPMSGDGQLAFIDPRDVGSAAAHILLLPSDMMTAFLDMKRIELHGPSVTSINEQLELLSAAVGYTIKINTIPAEMWVKSMLGYGMSKLFANSFLQTMQVVDGEVYPVSDVYSISSALLYATGWEPVYDVSTWSTSDHVLAAFKK